MTGSRKGKISSQLPGQQCSADFPFAGWVRLSGLRKLCPDTEWRENPATWIEMLHLSSSYECMIHFSGTPSPGSEGFETARLSLVIHGDGTTAYLQGGGWHIISGLTATMNIWQTNQLDVDLAGVPDAQRRDQSSRARNGRRVRGPRHHITSGRCPRCPCLRR